MAASAAIAVSDIPFNGPTSEVRVGKVDGDWVINPTPTQMENSNIDLKLEVYNQFGRKVKEVNMSSEQEIINLESKNPGVYFLKISSADQTFIRKIILLE